MSDSRGCDKSYNFEMKIEKKMHTILCILLIFELYNIAFFSLITFTELFFNWKSCFIDKDEDIFNQ